MSNRTVAPTPEEMAEILGVSRERVQKVRDIMSPVFVERASDGRYAVRRRGANTASAILPTQAEAIKKARRMNPGTPPLVERVRDTGAGEKVKWRRAS